MSNLEIRITTELGPLAEITQRLQNSQTLYKIWANHLEGVAALAFKTETAPYSSAWQPLKPETVKAKQRPRKDKKKGRNKILQDQGYLYATVQARALPDGAVVGTNRIVGNYSLGAIHQFGAPRRNIPARPFLPIDAQGNALPQLATELQELTEEFFRV